MSKPTIEIILIDPDTRVAAVVESNGSLEHVYQLVKADYVEHLQCDSRHVLLFAEQPESEVGFYLFGHLFMGKAVIVGTKREGFDSVTVSLPSLRDQLSWVKK
jgi:hypothetical protein